MALIQCHECGKEISEQAAACPGCGAPVKREEAQAAQAAPPSGFAKAEQHVAAASNRAQGVLQFGFAIFVIAAVAWWFFGGDKDKKTAEASAPQPAAEAPKAWTRLQPEQIIEFDKPHVACITVDYLDQALHMIAHHEETKFNGLIADNKCVGVAPKLKMKVLSIARELDDFSVIEIVPAENTTAHNGVFTQWDYAAQAK